MFAVCIKRNSSPISEEKTNLYIVLRYRCHFLLSNFTDHLGIEAIPTIFDSIPRAHR